MNYVDPILEVLNDKVLEVIDDRRLLYEGVLFSRAKVSDNQLIR